jgi:hypothetical protein
LETIELVDKYFCISEKELAVSLLAEECGNNLPFCERTSPTGLERIRFAVIKLSSGNINKLKSAIELAQTDWRDLLVSADFAEDNNAHKLWAKAQKTSKN